MTHHKTSYHDILPFNRSTRAWQLAGLATLLLSPAAWTDNFQSVAYDAATDELVIVVNYRGTNPDHPFTLNWGECQTKDDNRREIFGDLVDQQARDGAHQDYRKTLRFSLRSLDCRPATATLRTAPRFFATVSIPAARPTP